MATTTSGTMGFMHLVAAGMFLVIMSCMLMPTTFAVCDILPQKCNQQNCNMQKCQQWYGNQNFEKVYCKKTPFNDLCCCDFHAHPPPAGHHPSRPSHHASPHVAI
ncbi:hypothetical protein HU200_016688 [Digitaria exilis]|uniref:Uncharacterized protein n=1 Tax=Digitaria exilis TaxID=1010633 RepID=A0A835KGT7_9POAL|nr:hypothetical protein HU200_016688 [Digitaria exilis]CAB3491247.1 unnamed protein product [Digitaria exilis]